MRTPASLPARSENVSLNAMRAVAAILVVAAHVRSLFLRDYAQVPHTAPNKALYAVLSLGHPAVVLFFVLSGYWVGGSVIRGLQRGRFSWGTYAVNRLTRLWLVLIPALILTALLDYIGLGAFGHTSVFQDAPGYFLFPPHLHANLTPVVALANVAFLQTIHAKVFGNNTPLWSLAYEFWFYALFPAALVACVARTPALRRVGFAVLAIAIVIFIGGTVVGYFGLWLLGALVAYKQPAILRLMRGQTARRERVLRATLLVLVALAMVLAKAKPSGGANALLGVLAAGLIAVLLLDRGWGRLRHPVHGLARYAHSSYSLYTVHFPLVALWAAIIVPHIDQRWRPTGLHLILVAVIVGAAMAVAWGFAWCTEHNTDAVRSAVFAVLRRRGTPISATAHESTAAAPEA